MKTKKINLVVADMGYGHQRAAYPLLDLSVGEVINVNNYPEMPDWEKRYWLNSLKSYEKISRFKKIPLLGELVFQAMDEFQEIDNYYPFRDLSKQSVQQKFYLQSLKKGLGRDLMEKLALNRLPFVTTFFVAAYMAEYFNYPGNIYLVVCDADASRAWAPLDPSNSRIKFLLPNNKLKKRFLMYGVKEESLVISGFPLPKENVGENKEILKKDLARRLLNLDPLSKYRKKYQSLISNYFEIKDEKIQEPLTITFAVGGAGAQKEIGATILEKLASRIKAKEIKLNLIAGVRPEVRQYFFDNLQKNGIIEGEGVQIIFASEKNDYFRLFNNCLHETDILWTKPSELSFYCALGLPIVMSSPVGSQEDFNREWLINIGAGIDSFAPEDICEWLPDMLNSGRLARAAMDGFLNAEQMGVYNIEKIINSLK